MATSRGRGDKSFPTRSPNCSVPDVIGSSPATIRSAVVLPHPDGPTSTANSPGSTARSRPSTARTPVAYTLVRPSSDTAASAGTSASKTQIVRSVRDAAEQHAAPPVALQHQEQGDHRDDGHQPAHHHQRVQVAV